MSITLCASSEIPVNTRKFYDVGGESVAILNVDGELYAIRNTCPHMGGPVGEGKVVRKPSGSERPVSRFQTFSPGRKAVVGEPIGSRDERGIAPPTISCPLHGWEFDLASGEPAFPAKRGVTTYEVWVEDGLVKLEDRLVKRDPEAEGIDDGLSPLPG